MPCVDVITEQVVKDYTICTVQSRGRRRDIWVTSHAKGRLQRWRLTLADLMEALVHSEEVVRGHYQRFIAHKLRGGRLVRVVYEYRHTHPVVVTVYVPRAERYYQGGGAYADQILP